MKNALWILGGSAAWIAASALGPRIAFAPADGGGAGGGGEGGDGGAGGKGDGAGEGGGAGAGGLGDRAKGSLFDRREKGAQDKGAGGEGDGGGQRQDAADGRPEWMPEKFWDAKAKAGKFEDMAKAYGELEAAHGKLKRDKAVGGEVPETDEGYFPEGFDVSKEAANYGKIEADDPGLKAWASTCRKYGIGKELASNLARDMFGAMNEFAPTPVDPEQEFAALGKNAQGILDGVFTFLEAGERSGKLSESDMEIAIDLSRTAAGIRFLRSMRDMTGADPIPFIPATGGKAMTREQWDAEYKAAITVKDERRRAELDGMFDTLFGGSASAGLRAGVDPNKVRGVQR